LSLPPGFIQDSFPLTYNPILDNRVDQIASL
jgi:hypothetical protein